MVSEITRSYWQPDTTSSSVLRQDELHEHVLDGFWRSDRDFLIASHSNFLSGMHGFRDNEVFLQAGYDVMVISPAGALHAILHNGFWKSDMHDFQKASHSNFYLRCTVSEITRLYCKPDMTSSWFLRQGSLHAILHEGFWKSDHNLLITFHSNVLSAMHGFRDNKVLLPNGYDAIVSPPPGGRSTHIIRTDSERATMTF